MDSCLVVFSLYVWNVLTLITLFISSFASKASDQNEDNICVNLNIRMNYSNGNKVCRNNSIYHM